MGWILTITILVWCGVCDGNLVLNGFLGDDNFCELEDNAKFCGPVTGCFERGCCLAVAPATQSLICIRVIDVDPSLKLFDDELYWRRTNSKLEMGAFRLVNDVNEGLENIESMDLVVLAKDEVQGGGSGVLEFYSLTDELVRISIDMGSVGGSRCANFDAQGPDYGFRATTYSIGNVGRNPTNFNNGIAVGSDEIVFLGISIQSSKLTITVMGYNTALTVKSIRTKSFHITGGLRWCWGFYTAVVLVSRIQIRQPSPGYEMTVPLVYNGNLTAVHESNIYVEGASGVAVSVFRLEESVNMVLIYVFVEEPLSEVLVTASIPGAGVELSAVIEPKLDKRCSAGGFENNGQCSCFVGYSGLVCEHAQQSFLERSHAVHNIECREVVDPNVHQVTFTKVYYCVDLVSYMPLLCVEFKGLNANYLTCRNGDQMFFGEVTGRVHKDSMFQKMIIGKKESQYHQSEVRYDNDTMTGKEYVYIDDEDVRAFQDESVYVEIFVDDSLNHNYFEIEKFQIEGYNPFQVCIETNYTGFVNVRYGAQIEDVECKYRCCVKMMQDKDHHYIKFVTLHGSQTIYVKETDYAYCYSRCGGGWICIETCRYWWIVLIIVVVMGTVYVEVRYFELLKYLDIRSPTKWIYWNLGWHKTCQGCGYPGTAESVASHYVRFPNHEKKYGKCGIFGCLVALDSDNACRHGIYHFIGFQMFWMIRVWVFIVGWKVFRAVIGRTPLPKYPKVVV